MTPSINNNTVRTVMRRAIVASVALACAAPLAAQNLPDARAVLARYAEATGAGKLVGQPGYHITGSLEVAAQGLKGTLEGWRDLATDRSLQIVTLPGLGEIRTGSDSAFAWSVSLIEGAKILEQKEFTELREKEDLRAMRRDPSVVIDAIVTARAMVDSQPCVMLKLKWKSGRETTECYSDASGLLLRSESVETTAAGAIPMSTTYGEYKTFGVVTLPTKSVQRAAGLEITQRTNDVVFGPIDSALLTPPVEIQALRKQ